MKNFFTQKMYLSDSEEEIELIIKFSTKKVTFDESKNKVFIFNELAPPKLPKYNFLFQQK